MRILHRLGSWYGSLSPARQTILQNVVIWTIAGTLVWYLARGLTIGKFFKELKEANIAEFVAANVGSFLIWWLGETFLFTFLFSYFHTRTTFREVLPASTAQYFLQAINILAAAGAMVVFLNRRKGVKWVTAGWTMLFLGFTDAITLAAMMVAAGLLVPESKIRMALPFASVALAFFILVAFWWMWGKPKTRLEKWLYNRPSMHAFRKAGLREYAVLCGIRAAIIVPQGFLLYWSLDAFAHQIPLRQVLALTPAIVLAASEPITPSGLGPLQAIVVDGLAHFAPRAEVLAAALGISIMYLLCRLPLGFGAAGTFARKVLAIEAGADREQDRDGGEAEGSGPKSPVPAAAHE